MYCMIHSCVSCADGDNVMYRTLYKSCGNNKLINFNLNPNVFDVHFGGSLRSNELN